MSLASARLSKKVEAAMSPDPTKEWSVCPKELSLEATGGDGRTTLPVIYDLPRFAKYLICSKLNAIKFRLVYLDF